MNGFMKTIQRTVSVRGVGLALACLVLAGGCGESRTPTAMVTGSVEYKGKKLDSGAVHLYEPSEGVGVVCPINADGQYATPEKIVTGVYRIEIRAEDAPPPAPGSNELPPPPMGPRVPRKFMSISTSGLQTEVKDGENLYDISLK